MLRKKFLQKTILGTGSLFAIPLLSLTKQDDLKKLPVDQLPPDKVKDFVVAGHGNLDKVKSMLLELPTLLYATWDWGRWRF